jgi:hypothetical protein
VHLKVHLPESPRIFPENLPINCRRQFEAEQQFAERGSSKKVVKRVFGTGAGNSFARWVEWTGGEPFAD